MEHSDIYNKIKDASKSLKSIEITNPDQWSKLKSGIQGVMIVGSSCSGKSTLVNAIRNKGKDIVVPKRIITRPQRLNDNLVENMFRSKDEFKQMIESGEIGLHWTRKMEGSREEQYGFESVSPEKFVAYSGNNALYNNRDSVRPKETLDDHLYVGIYAPDEVRKNRLLSRSPDMKLEELEYRLNDKSENILAHCHIVVNNFGPNENCSDSDLIKVIELLRNQ